MKIAVGLPSADSRACLPLTQSLVSVVNAGFDRGIRFIECSLGMSALLPTIRDVIAADAIASGADALWFIDQDQSFEPDDFFALLDPIERGMADVVGSAAAQKEFDRTRIQVACMNFESDVFRSAVGRMNFHTIPGQGFRLGKNVYLPARIGMGSTLISRKALEATGAIADRTHETLGPEGQAAKPTPVLFEGPAEDLNFCRLCERAGMKVFAHVNSRILHWGLTAYRNNAVQLLREQGVNLEFPDSATQASL